MKHTSGPWAICEIRNEHCEVDRCIVDHMYTKIAVCEQWNEPVTEESDANARLIAAAPELLEALQSAENAMTEASGASLPAARVVSAAIHQARAAIANATK